MKSEVQKSKLLFPARGMKEGFMDAVQFGQGLKRHLMDVLIEACTKQTPLGKSCRKNSFSKMA